MPVPHHSLFSWGICSLGAFQDRIFILISCSFAFAFLWRTACGHSGENSPFCNGGEETVLGSVTLPWEYSARTTQSSLLPFMLFLPAFPEHSLYLAPPILVYALSSHSSCLLATEIGTHLKIHPIMKVKTEPRVPRKLGCGGERKAQSWERHAKAGAGSFTRSPEFLEPLKDKHL